MAMDVFLMPSHFEGLPVAGIEAQTTGLRCIFSDAVTKETDITGLCEFISLKESDDYWAERVLLPYERKDVSELILGSGYDVAEGADWLIKFYEGVYNE